MIKTLYKSFQHWSERGSVYIISDPHFEDLDMNWRWSLINDYPYMVLDWFKDSEEYIACKIASYIIYQLNKKCTKNDTLIILGDIGDAYWISEINAGHKVLVAGNHDKGLSSYEAYFDELYGGPLFISEKILLSHERIEGPWLNIHGHEHHAEFTEGSFINNIYDANKQINYKALLLNVCAETNAFMPINLGDLIKSGVLKEVDGIHRITIDKATINSKH